MSRHTRLVFGLDPFLRKGTVLCDGTHAPRSSALDFVLEATEESIVKQLKELLKSRDLTCDELGLLYCYKHGVSTNQALKTIGIDAKLAPLLHFSDAMVWNLGTRTGQLEKR